MRLLTTAVVVYQQQYRRSYSSRTTSALLLPLSSVEVGTFVLVNGYFIGLLFPQTRVKLSFTPCIEGGFKHRRLSEQVTRCQLQRFHIWCKFLTQKCTGVSRKSDIPFELLWTNAQRILPCASIRILLRSTTRIIMSKHRSTPSQAEVYLGIT